MGMTVYVVDPDATESGWIESVLAPHVDAVRRLDDAGSLLALLGVREGACLIVSAEPDAPATLEFVRELRLAGSMIPVIAIGSRSAFRTATEIARFEATDFLERPLSAYHLRAAVRRAGDALAAARPPCTGTLSEST